MKKILLGLVAAFGVAGVALPAFAEEPPAGAAPAAGADTKPAPKKHGKKHGPKKPAATDATPAPAAK